MLDRPRKIVFGLQATPVKPMPQGWRGWNFIGLQGPNLRPMRILGQGQFWGAATQYTDVYPRKCDFSIFEKFAETRRTGIIDSGFIEQWLKGYEPPLAGDKLIEFRSDVTYGFQQCVNNQPIIPYTNSRGGSTGPEGAYFAAEQFHSEPVECFQDFALFYFKKMMDTGIDGIYFDNMYLTANSDPIASDGAAYVRPDGSIQPSVGLFNMRQYLKRVAITYHEAGKAPLTVVHMTNGNIIPALSFATVALDWEAKAGGADSRIASPTTSSSPNRRDFNAAWCRWL